MAFALQVRWQESDLSILATDPTVPGSTYSAPSAATATPSTVQSTAASGTNDDIPTPSSSSSNTVAQNDDPTSKTESGIPAGTIIGIVIGVGGMVAALAISAVVFFIWRHRRKKREESGTRIESMISGITTTDGGDIAKRVRGIGEYGPLEKTVCGEGPASIKTNLEFLHISVVDNDNDDRAG
ncbi:hypothetical protein SLS64_008104 [Diaporthe eres]